MIHSSRSAGFLTPRPVRRESYGECSLKIADRYPSYMPPECSRTHRPPNRIEVTFYFGGGGWHLHADKGRRYPTRWIITPSAPMMLTRSVLAAELWIHRSTFPMASECNSQSPGCPLKGITSTDPPHKTQHSTCKAGKTVSPRNDVPHNRC